jgi:hypothetical protein
MSHRKAFPIIAASTALLLTACIVRAREVVVESVPAPAAATVVNTPVKAHLLDGSTVVYPTGLTVTPEALDGEGRRYDLRLRPVGHVTRVLLDSVAGMESYRTGTNVPASVALTIPATALGALGASALFVAIFGSCPTIYSDSAGTAVLEAETFSYSIAPLFEVRDVDRLSVGPDSAGVVRLEVRNEALETHYLNHLELLEVRHAAHETVLPDPVGKPLVTSGESAPASAVDRSGRDVRGVLATSDGVVYQTDEHFLAAARVEDLRDHIDLTFAPPPDADSAALVLRLRNSLLTTILFYDVMLASQGARALDWLGADMQQVGHVLELGQWYRRHMGLRILIRRDGEFEEIGRIGDTGPIAWKDIAVLVPVAEEDSVRIRLSFVTDSWRIDRVALASSARSADPHVIPAVRVANVEGGLEPEALLHLRTPDEQYLRTTPGQRFFLYFETGTRDAEPRTFLLASQGYYTEWIRPMWIRGADPEARFEPSDARLLETIERWRPQRRAFEEQFYRTKIPVR